MLPVWLLTVPTETKRSPAASELVLPEASMVSTSSSRSLNGSSSPREAPWPLRLLIAETRDRRPAALACRVRQGRRPRRLRPFASPGDLCGPDPSSIFDASSTVSEVRIAAVAGVSPPLSSRAPRSSFSFSLVPGPARRDASCASMARFICPSRSTGATTPIPKTANPDYAHVGQPPVYHERHRNAAG